MACGWIRGSTVHLFGYLKKVLHLLKQSLLVVVVLQHDASCIVSLGADPRATGVLPVGRLKKRLLAACRNRFICGLESLLCPFFHRLSFGPVPDRSFPDLTIFGEENSNLNLNNLWTSQRQMTLSLSKWRHAFSRVKRLLGFVRFCQQMAQFGILRKCAWGTLLLKLLIHSFLD